MGPAAKVAFDASGQPTRALLGFCAGKGVDVASVRRVETPKGEYVAVTVAHTGRAADRATPPMLAAVAKKLAFPKSMRWDRRRHRFGRPVRWLAALLGARCCRSGRSGSRRVARRRGHGSCIAGTVEVARARRVCRGVAGVQGDRGPRDAAR